MGKLGKFQMRGFTSWAHLTSDNHLSALGHLMPQRASNVIVNLLAFQTGYSNLEYQLNKFPTREFDSDEEYYWDVMGSSRRNIPLVEARTLGGSEVTDAITVGVGGEPFYLVFNEDWFALGEVIFGNYNEVYPIRILADAKMEGTNAVDILYAA